VTIIAAGPLTNLALAVRLDPKFSSLAKELVFMGGSFNPRPSNNASPQSTRTPPRREFNMRWDPEAASMVLHEPWRKITQVPIDSTTKRFSRPTCASASLEAALPSPSTSAKFGQSYPMWDELAVAAWLDPSIVNCRQATAGRCRHQFHRRLRGHPELVDREGPGLGEKPGRLVLDIDLPKFEP